MVDDQGETPSMNFSKAKDGKTTPVQIKSEKMIGRGFFGDVFTADTLIKGKKPWHFVIKRFRDKAEGTAEDYARSAMAKYEVARKVGLRVFRTYRLGEDGRSILMTNGNDSEVICVGKVAKFPGEMSSQLVDLGEPKLAPLSDAEIEALTVRIFDEASKGATNRLHIHTDAYFFIVNRETRAVDFVIGDLDNVKKMTGSIIGSLEKINIENSCFALSSFLENNVEGPEQNCKIIQENLNDTMYHRELTNA